MVCKVRATHFYMTCWQSFKKKGIRFIALFLVCLILSNTSLRFLYVP